ncbi:alpha/beta hydrolase [Thermodesulfobacteriota bacterium]
MARRPGYRRAAICGLGIILAAGILMSALFESIEKKFLYYPEKGFDFTPDQFGLVCEDVHFPAGDGVDLHGWLTAIDSPVATLLFLHGNAGNISHRLDNVRRLHDEGIRVFIIDYRGFGHSGGEISEEGLYQDAIGAYRYLSERPDVPPESIAVFGRSLGGAVAIDLAARMRLNALIVESSFTCVADMARHVFPILPVGPLLSSRYDSIGKITRINAPLLVIHGTRDGLIPFEQGRKLFDAAPGPKGFHAVEGGDHNDTYIVGGKPYLERIRSFLESCLGA